MNIEQLYHKIIHALSLPFWTIFGTQSDSLGEKRIYWLYLLSSLLLTFYIYVRSKRKEKFTEYAFHKKIWLCKSAFIDYTYIVFNSFLKVFLLSYILNWGTYISFYFEDFLVSQFSYSDLNIEIWQASLLFLISFTLLEDFFSFFVHWLFHYIPFLWQFHKVHHSATVLNPITQYRIHPVELILNNLAYLVAFGLVHGLFSWMFFNQKEIITTISTNIFAILFFIWGANLRHSHVKLAYYSFLENWFISPYQHQIHHSDNPKHWNKNMGSKLAIWDFIFGTLVKSKEAKSIKFGIGTKEGKEFDTFLKSLFIPFKKMFINKD